MSKTSLKNRDEHVNDSAYEGYEVFSSKPEEEKYRKAKLDDVKNKVSRIKTLFSRKINVLDVGSGNSKFLYALREEGILNKGYGVELSKSRYEFANRWKDDLGADNVININKDIFCCDLASFPKFDLIFCADLAFQFFEPVKRGAGVAFLKKIHGRINNGGVIVLELDDHNKILKCMDNNRAKIWQEFDEPDPWQYLLWDCELKNSHLALTKVFTHRTTTKISKSSVVLRNYTRHEASELLRSCNFSDIEIFEYWKTQQDISKDEFIVVGRIPSIVLFQECPTKTSDAIEEAFDVIESCIARDEHE